MKSRLLTLFSLIFLTVILSSEVSAQTSRGTKSVGVKTGYATFNKSAMAGIEMQYAFSQHFVLAPSIDFVFRNEDVDGILVNLDYHGPWQLDKTGKWYFYHILGVNYASWSAHSKDYTNPSTDDDVTQRTNRFGLDFGAGLDYYVRPTLKLSLQGKFNWLKGYNTGLFNLGISYVF